VNEWNLTVNLIKLTAVVCVIWVFRRQLASQLRRYFAEWREKRP